MSDKTTRAEDKFLKEYLKCFDIDKACESAGTNKELVTSKLQDASTPLFQAVNRACERLKISSGFVNDDMVKLKLWHIMLSDDASIADRIRAAKVCLGVGQQVAESEKFGMLLSSLKRDV